MSEISFVLLVFEMSPPKKGLELPIFEPSDKFSEMLLQKKRYKLYINGKEIL